MNNLNKNKTTMPEEDEDKPSGEDKGKGKAIESNDEDKDKRPTAEEKGKGREIENDEDNVPSAQDKGRGKGKEIARDNDKHNCTNRRFEWLPRLFDEREPQSSDSSSRLTAWGVLNHPGEVGLSNSANAWVTAGPSIAPYRYQSSGDRANSMWIPNIGPSSNNGQVEEARDREWSFYLQELEYNREYLDWEYAQEMADADGSRRAQDGIEVHSTANLEYPDPRNNRITEGRQEAGTLAGRDFVVGVNVPRSNNVVTTRPRSDSEITNPFEDESAAPPSHARLSNVQNPFGTLANVRSPLPAETFTQFQPNPMTPAFQSMAATFGILNVQSSSNIPANTQPPTLSGTLEASRPAQSTSQTKTLKCSDVASSSQASSSRAPSNAPKGPKADQGKPKKLPRTYFESKEYHMSAASVPGSGTRADSSPGTGGNVGPGLNVRFRNGKYLQKGPVLPCQIRAYHEAPSPSAGSNVLPGGNILPQSNVQPRQGQNLPHGHSGPSNHHPLNATFGLGRGRGSGRGVRGGCRGRGRTFSLPYIPAAIPDPSQNQAPDPGQKSRQPQAPLAASSLSQIQIQSSFPGQKLTQPRFPTSSQAPFASPSSSQRQVPNVGQTFTPSQVPTPYQISFVASSSSSSQAYKPPPYKQNQKQLSKAAMENNWRKKEDGDKKSEDEKNIGGKKGKGKEREK
jgi:hypothetical protein